MSHDKPGPNEIRLRELREERIRKQGGRKLIPYAGKEPSTGPSGSFRTKRAKKGKKS